MCGQTKEHDARNMCGQTKEHPARNMWGQTNEQCSSWKTLANKESPQQITQINTGEKK